MRCFPIRYVEDVETAVAFYETLGFVVEVRGRTGSWVELRGTDGSGLALHRGPSDFEANFATSEPLEDIAERLRSQGHRPGPIVDEAYGRSLTVTDPGGLAFTVTAYDTDLYA